MIDLQKAYKSFLRKTGFVKKYWFKKYNKALVENNIKRQIKLINKLDLYERKNLLKPIIKRIIWVDLDDIKYIYYNDNTNNPLEKNFFYKNFIATGNWDINKYLIYPDYYSDENHIGAIGFRTIYQLIEKDYDINKTDEYKAKINRYNPDKLFNEIESYINKFETIKNQGYQSQLDLGEGLKGRKIYDEIRIAIDRNGDFAYICSSGNHRLAMAKILKLKKVPVIVDGIHQEYLDISNNLLSEINNKLACINNSLDRRWIINDK